MQPRTLRQQRTLDFYFSPRGQTGSESPDLRHFKHEARLDEASASPTVTTACISMDVSDDHTSDDEPIGKRKRPARTSSRSGTSGIDVKRPCPEDADAESARDVVQEKIRQWTPELSHQFSQLASEPALGGGEECRLRTCLPFLLPEAIRDDQGRRPEDPHYDSSTLFVPPDWFDSCKISAGQRQWWTFKAANFDSLLLFKVGKFYELFEMDAHVGVEVLGLKYMKGDQPHCGFPEAAYSDMTAALAEHGHNVVVIEQTETPEQLKRRNDGLKQRNQPIARVVNREKVAVVTKGTLRDAEMMDRRTEAQYLMSLCAEESSGSISVGLCAVDVASSQFLLSQFSDNGLLALLRTQISVLDPVEFLLPVAETEANAKLHRIVAELAPTARVNTVHNESVTSNEVLGCYFGAGTPPLPRTLETVLQAPEQNSQLLTACVSVVEFLKKALLDTAIIPISTFQLLPPPNHNSEGSAEPVRVFLDGSALENLEIFKDSDGKPNGSLLAFLDHCQTPFGKRLLKSWISKPLVKISEIEARQDAIQDLLTTGAGAMGRVRRQMGSLGDLERLLSRLHSNSLKGFHGREADHVILYEDAAQKRVKSLAAAILGVQTVQDVVLGFQSVALGFASPLLRSLVTPGQQFPHMEAALGELQKATDWKEAQKTGTILPLPVPPLLLSLGVVPGYDAAKDKIQSIQNRLDAFLESLTTQLGAKGSELSYLPVRKEKYVIEVSERLVMKIPADFELVSQRKGYKRFTCAQLKDLVEEIQSAEAQSEKELGTVLHQLLDRFVQHQQIWSSAVGAMAQLDALMSLTVAAVCISGPSCRPKLLPDTPLTSPMFRATLLGHPNLAVEGDFVRNDVELGGQSANFMVLTGANMGGKSTLLRQVCLATLLAQIGAWVPAEQLDLTPVDSIFVRMGAKDRIVCGQSTFFVELSETANMLRNATRRSLVALDELGRGTATSDGEAIAYGVLKHLSSHVGCRGMFATHYHALAQEFGNSPNVALRHMSCHISGSGERDVRFLYKLAEGVAPRSYGMHVARLAGLTEEVIEKANQISAETEDRMRLKNEIGSETGL